MIKRFAAALAVVASAAAGQADAHGHARTRAQAPAELVVIHARILTENATRGEAEAMAVTGGRIVWVGSAKAAKAYIGPQTRVEDLGGRLVLPGLIDSHIHPTEIVQLDVCDLQSEAKTLAQMTEFVRGCIARYHTPAGHWVLVQQWAFADGNKPDAAHPTLRAALDLASRDHPVELLGNDGHHGAFNSAAFARAALPGKSRAGLTAATLSGPFRAYAKLVGVDAAGDPNGTVNEEARDLMGAPDEWSDNMPALMKAPERIVQVLNHDGITAVQDAAVTPQMQVVYDTLQSRGQLSVRVNMAQLYEPEDYRRPNGSIDYDRIVALAVATRGKYAANPLIKADAVKLFADGVLEGNPFATPPTQPDSPMLRPYLQPIFGRDAQGGLTVNGYVDADTDMCKETRAQPPVDAAAAAAYLASHGYAATQCDTSSGKLQHDPQVIMDYLRRMHLAGFTLHVHAIGDAAVKIAIDGIEAARAADHVTTRPDTIAHFQIARDADIARAGRDHLYLAYTYAWAYTDPMYDMMVVPFIERVDGSGYAALHKPDSYYERNAYPVRATKAAGAILVAGSDAPVDTRDPRPFINMMSAVMRNGDAPQNPGLNLSQAVGVRDAVDAYTINGAHALGREGEIGSLETGKSADFIVMDRDFVALAEIGRPEQIGQAQVLQTWFQGREVYARK